MKGKFFNWMTIIVMAFMCAGFTSCGGDDDDDDIINDPKPEGSNSGKESGGSTKTILTPGYYFSLEASSFHEIFSSKVARGDYNGIANYINTTGSNDYDTNVWKVEYPDMVGVMIVRVTLQYPTDSGIKVVYKQTYHTTTVYYYIDTEQGCPYDVLPWESWKKGDRITYSNGVFTDTGFSGTAYYKLVK